MLWPQGLEQGIQPLMDVVEVLAQFPAAISAVFCKGGHGETVAGLVIVGKAG